MKLKKMLCFYLKEKEKLKIKQSRLHLSKVDQTIIKDRSHSYKGYAMQVRHDTVRAEYPYDKYFTLVSD